MKSTKSGSLVDKGSFVLAKLPIKGNIGVQGHHINLLVTWT